MSLKGTFTTLLYTHPAIVFIVSRSILSENNSFLSSIQFADEKFWFDVLHSSFRFSTTKTRHFTSVFACMLRHTCTCITLPKNMFLCVIYDPNQHTIDGFHFGWIWKTSFFSPFFNPSSMHVFVVCMSILVKPDSILFYTTDLTSLHLDNLIYVYFVSWMFVVMFFVFFSTRKAIQSFLLSV